MILIIYVDDVILIGDDVIEMERLKNTFATKFEIKDLSPLRYFPGMEIARNKSSILVS